MFSHGSRRNEAIDEADPEQQKERPIPVQRVDGIAAFDVDNVKRGEMPEDLSLFAQVLTPSNELKHGKHRTRKLRSCLRASPEIYRSRHTAENIDQNVQYQRTFFLRSPRASTFILNSRANVWLSVISSRSAQMPQRGVSSKLTFFRVRALRFPFLAGGLANACTSSRTTPRRAFGTRFSVSVILFNASASAVFARAGFMHTRVTRATVLSSRHEIASAPLLQNSPHTIPKSLPPAPCYLPLHDNAEDLRCRSR